MATGSDNPNMTSFNGDLQVMSRPNVVDAQTAVDDESNRVLVNGAQRSELRGPVSSGPLDLDGETTLNRGMSGVDDLAQPMRVTTRPTAPNEGDQMTRPREEVVRGFLLGPDGEALTSSEIPAPPVTPRPKRMSSSFLGGMAKAVQSLPAAVEGLMRPPVLGAGSQGTRTAEAEGYASAQSISPDGAQGPSSQSASVSQSASASRLLDERTLRRLNEMPQAAPHLYPPDPPSSGPRLPSTTSSDIQNEVRRQLQEFMLQRDEETRALRTQVEMLVSENQMLQRDRAELLSREVGTRSENQGFFPGFGWIGRGFGNLMSGFASPKPPAPPRALDSRPAPPPASLIGPGLGHGCKETRNSGNTYTSEHHPEEGSSGFPVTAPPRNSSISVPEATPSYPVQPRALDFCPASDSKDAAPTASGSAPTSASPQDPMSVVLTGMAQLQGVIADLASSPKASNRPEVIKPGVAALQELPPAGPEACLAFSDWLHSTKPALADVSDSSEELWELILSEAKSWYARHLRLDAIARLTDKPIPSATVLQPKWARVSRRIESMILTAAPPAVRDEISSARVSGLLPVMCRLYTIYAPGGLTEREIGLRQILEPSQGTSVRDTIEILRRWKRWGARMVELGGTLPDSALQLKALERISRGTLQAHPEVSFRISLTRAALQIDTCPDDTKVGQLHAQILAELESLGHRSSKEERSKEGSSPAHPKIKGVESGDNAAKSPLNPKTKPSAKHQGNLRGSTSTEASSSGGIPCTFFVSEKGCKKGADCTFVHNWQAIPANERSQRCRACGAKGHRASDCK